MPKQRAARNERSNERGITSIRENRDLMDNQQRYDNSTQEYENSLGFDGRDGRDLQDEKHFARDFYRYSRNYRDNDNGAPGADDDYGIYQSRENHVNRGGFSAQDHGYKRGTASPSHPSPSESARDSHVGRGPKGYKRSDDRIREEACEALYHDADVDASDLEVDVEDGIVTLRGTIETRRMKRMAENCVEALPGVNDVRNDLRIVGAGAQPTESLKQPTESLKTASAKAVSKKSSH